MRMTWRILLLVLLCGTAQAATYYVRTDGGSSTQCTGLANAAYPGSGTGLPCAWNHPFRALPPGGTPRISGGDTLIIGSGSYRMGYGAPGAGACDANGAYDCIMLPIPSGPNPGNPTRILGNSQSPPELWGAERPWFIINMTDSSNVELGYLEITDHSGCVESHSGGLACERDTPPYGDWASYGLYAEDSASVYLHDLNIHGLASGGVHAGRLTDWTVEHVRIAGNGSVGWDGDLWDAPGDSNSGTLTFRYWTVEWNGCGETYPGQQPTGCWAQSAGGYGDGVATGESGGHWIIEDSVIRYNTSDGLDFLYVREPGSSIEIRRTLAEGNAGNQIKNFRGPFLLENSIIVGNCGFFDARPFTYDVDNCRALGDALALGLTAGDQITVRNNTFTSEGDCLVTAEFYGASPTGSESVLMRNNIFQGQTDFLQPFESTCLVYQETFPNNPFNVDYSIINNVKDDLCPGSHDQCGVAPGLTNEGTDTFDAHLLGSSPALDAGLAGAAPPDDFDGNARDSQPDIGAYEYGAVAAFPTVVSIIRTNPSPTGAASVNFTVTFSRSVTGVDVTDFTLTTSGVTGAWVSAVDGAGTTYTVTVNTGSGDGTLRLNVTDDDTIVDDASSPLGGSGPGNGDFTSGQVYTIQRGSSIFFDDFEDNNYTGWSTSAPGKWTVSSGELKGTTTGKADISSPLFSGCSQCAYEANLKIQGEGYLVLYPWFASTSNFVELRLYKTTQKLYLKQKINGTSIKKSVSVPVSNGTVYNLKVTFDGTLFHVFFNGVEKLTMSKKGTSNGGQVKFRVKSPKGSVVIGSFLDIRVY